MHIKIIAYKLVPNGKAKARKEPKRNMKSRVAQGWIYRGCALLLALVN